MQGSFKYLHPAWGNLWSLVQMASEFPTIVLVLVSVSTGKMKPLPKVVLPHGQPLSLLTSILSSAVCHVRASSFLISLALESVQPLDVSVMQT